MKWLEPIVDSDALAVALLVSISTVVVGARLRVPVVASRLVPAAGVTAGLLAGMAVEGWSGGVAAAAVAGVALGLVSAAPTAWANSAHWAVVSVVAVGGVYGCVPDTERALAMLGAVVGAAGASLLVGSSWSGARWAVTVPLASIVVVDGSIRPSALVGGLGVVGVHALATWRPIGTTTVVLATAAIAVCSRVAGLGPGVARPVLIAGACNLVLLGWLRPWSRRP